MNFEKLEKINCADKIEKRKDGNTELSYLSWAWAWSIFKKNCPDATYNIKKFQNKNNELVPYMYDDNTGYMVNTEITVENITYEMWLPVMNSANKAMKAEPYTYQVKEYKWINGKNQFTGNYIDKQVEAATMFDVNKTIMRCLVKNMAMFGLGLYIYAGEDLPENEEQKEQPKQKAKTKEPEIDADLDLINELKTKKDMPNLVKFYNDNKVNAKNQMKFTQEFQKLRATINKKEVKQ